MARDTRRTSRRQPEEVRDLQPFGTGNARAVAYDLIVSAAKGSDHFEQIWNYNPGLLQLSTRDRALAVHIASGVLRRYRALDARARELTSGKFDGLTEPIQWILRIGLFQVIDCDRIPPHAAVSTAVEAAKAAAHQGIAGLVNAVLRRAVRERENPPTEQDPAKKLSWGDQLSMPDWLVELLFTRFGEEAADQIARWANAPPHHYFRLAKNGPGIDRLNELLHAADLAPGRPHRDFPEYVGIETAALTSDSPLFKELLGWVQNPGAGMVVRLLDPQPGDQVFDLFSAPGGKALVISELVGPDGQVLAVDRSPSRLHRLKENKMRLGANNILPIEADVAGLDKRTTRCVLADVPCSALGTLSKNPEVRWIRTPADIERLARSQRIWLNLAASHVEQGGVLVYSTCTIASQENEDIIAAFLKSNPEFTLESASDFLPDQFVTDDGYLSTNPPFDGLDGVFAARMRRQGGGSSA